MFYFYYRKKGVNIMKKTWEMPSVEEVSISKTEHNWTGIHRDGGYIGDGIISGHLGWDKPDGPGCGDKPSKPSCPGDQNPPTDGLS